MSEKFTVDVAAYARVLEAQRNQALNDAAQWQAAADQLMAENKRLHEEIARLREAGTPD